MMRNKAGERMAAMKFEKSPASVRSLNIKIAAIDINGNKDSKTITVSRKL